MANYIATTVQFTATANAIRAKTGSSDSLEWDANTGYADDIAAIPTGDDTSDANASAADILSGKTAYVKGSKVTGNIPTKTSANLTASGSTVTVPSGYYSVAATKSVASTTHPNPTVSIDSSTGVITATHTQSAGYVTAGTTTGTLSLAFQPAQTITPGTTNQTIASGKYLTGIQTIKGDANLVASNIAEGISIFGVTGTHAGGGGDYALTAFIEDEIKGVFENSNVTRIRCGLFAFCNSLTSVSFPVCTSIGSNAFASCSNLTSTNFPVCTSIGISAFASCSNLTSTNFPVCTSIGSRAFMNCSKLTSINLPVCTSIGSGAFYSCYNLTSINLPVCTSIGSSAFMNCYKLTSVSFPACHTIGGYTFRSCTSLTAVVLSASLTKKSIYSQAFRQCYNLRSLYLLASAVYTLGHIDVFSSTPISNYTTSTGGVYGSIFVRSGLYASYKAATNWATYSARFVSLTDAQVANVMASGTHT